MSFRRITATAFVVTALALGTGGPAQAYSNGSGNSANAPGQQNAIENCSNNIVKQSQNGVSAGGGPKEGVLAPTNCDHFFN
jgi:hypothetical protein